jgi:rhodanese-related sulfurtransferase
MQSALRPRSIILLSVIIAISIIAYTLYESTIMGPTLRVTPQEARARRYGRIFDVRSPVERDRLGYYPHSLPLSMENLEKGIPLDLPTNTHILIYSNGDDRAQRAAEQISRMGYPNVRYLQETYQALLPGAVAM